MMYFHPDDSYTFLYVLHCVTCPYIDNLCVGTVKPVLCDLPTVKPSLVTTSIKLQSNLL
jgi:hypothetical protein